MGNPSLLARHAAAYDLSRERMVLFGGYDQSYNTQATTWEFDGVTWTPMIPIASPPARTGPAMTYDATRGYVVLFGGAATTALTPCLDDTWEYDGTTWTQRSSTHKPPARVDHAMAFDMARHCTVLHGGRFSTFGQLGDTWKWDGVDWIQDPAAGPSTRYRHAMAFDVARACTVLFGGFNGQTVIGDTWEWDGATWVNRQPAIAPSPRSGHSMAHDFQRGVTVMHGGLPAGDETWEWNGIAWIQQGSTVHPKTDHTLVYDARLQRTTLFGGMVTVNPMSFSSEAETYGHPAPGTWTAHGSSCPGSGSTALLFAPPTMSTGPMMGATSYVQVTGSWVHTFFVFGWSDTLEGGTPLPFDLTSFGMPGCALQVSRDAITSGVPANGVTTLAVPIINNPFVVGARFYVQGFALDLAANAGGFTTTNRLAALVGRT